MKIVPCNVFLRKVDGTELDIVNAARVSFHKDSKHLLAKDIKLIRYLAEHGHWTPFGHVNATFVIKAPLFVARQLGKHQVGLVWNEVSRRYVDDEPEFFFPDVWRGRPVNAKQGSEGVIELSSDYSHPGEVVVQALDTYTEMIKQGVAPEQARMILPQNMMTEWWWTGSLAAWARVFNLRLDPHTQEESRLLVSQMYDILLPHFPNAIPALVKLGENNETQSSK
jgi:thymidylate synthase (FAD)